MPTKLYIGKDALNNNKEIFSTFGKKCLIVTGKTSAKKCGAYDDLVKILKELKISYTLFDQVQQNPLVSTCIEAGKIAYQKKADFIVGIGGGSPQDSAKAIAIFASNRGLDEQGLYAGKYTKALPVIEIGTTAGTGSEVTKVAVLTNSKGLKKSIHHDLIYPAVSIGDPKYTLSLNRNFTLSTGIDALAHSIESYFSKKASDITRAYCIESCKKIIPVLKKMTNNKYKLTYNDREQLYMGSIFGGLAISQTGTCFPHTLGYYLSESKGIPHGYACAIYMSDLLNYVSKVDKNYTNQFFKEIQINKTKFISLIDELMPTFNIPFKKEELDQLMPRYENNSSIKNTIGNFGKQQIQRILHNKFSKTIHNYN